MNVLNSEKMPDINQFQIDKDGFLKNSNVWNEEFALQSANAESIKMSDDHWEVIYFLREYYSENKKSLAIRALVTALKKKFGPEKGNSLYLQSLFPESPAVQASKIAGLPKPTRCI
jgi:tRNA 2-thiouridine synthesizing protein E